jgi:hypothetical protein
MRWVGAGSQLLPESNFSSAFTGVKESYVSKKLFGRTERKRNWGRDTRIDSWERLHLVIELMKSGLPIDVSIDVDDADVPRPPTVAL